MARPSLTLAFATLAQDTGAAWQTVMWIVVLAGLTLVGGLLVMVLRRKLFAKDEPTQDVGLFDALKQMRDRGELSREEYDAARKRMLTKAAQQLKGDPRSSQPKNSQPKTPQPKTPQPPATPPSSPPE